MFRPSARRSRRRAASATSPERLPKALRRAGIDARVLTPAWPGVLDRARDMGRASAEAARHRLSRDKLALRLGARLARERRGPRRSICLKTTELFSNEAIYPEALNAETAEPMLFLSFAAMELEKRSEVEALYNPLARLADGGRALRPALAQALRRERRRLRHRLHDTQHRAPGALSPTTASTAGASAPTRTGGRSSSTGR